MPRLEPARALVQIAAEAAQYLLYRDCSSDYSRKLRFLLNTAGSSSGN
ncbi:MAG TPA: hypothetical protein PLP17_10590 [Oligoflexia bacterium]|nr:hypothetical protein [Oligoflexia bacterium]